MAIKRSPPLATAYCFRSGQVRITTGRKLPDGVLPLASAPSYRRLRRAVDGISRWAYDNRTRLVPGIPEAPNDLAAYAAARRFTAQLLDRLDGGDR